MGLRRLLVGRKRRSFEPMGQLLHYLGIDDGALLFDYSSAHLILLLYDLFLLALLQCHASVSLLGFPNGGEEWYVRASRGEGRRIV